MVNMQNINSFNQEEMNQNPTINMIKAILPYCEPRQRQMLGVVVKIHEIQELMAYGYDMGGVNYAHDNRADRFTHMINAMKPFMSEDKQSALDMLTGLMAMRGEEII
jgi:hypothetical protein